MSAPRNVQDAGQAARQLLKRSLPGSTRAVRTECDRSSQIARDIWHRWHVGPWQWKQKHVKWYLECRSVKSSRWTRYRYWLMVQRLLHAMGKLENWRPALRGPWTSPERGEPRSDTY